MKIKKGQTQISSVCLVICYWYDHHRTLVLNFIVVVSLFGSVAENPKRREEPRAKRWIWTSGSQRSRKASISWRTSFNFFVNTFVFFFFLSLLVGFCIQIGIYHLSLVRFRCRCYCFLSSKLITRYFTTNWSVDWALVAA